MDASALPQDLRGALVVAVEDSPASREALRWAARLASGLGQPLHVLSVWNFVNGQRPFDQGADETPTLAKWQAHAEARLRELVAGELPDAGSGTTVHPTALHGNTVPTLLAVSELAGHLIVGTRGRGGFTGLLLGSTSDQLTRYASCPVTVVRRGATH